MENSITYKELLNNSIENFSLGVSGYVSSAVSSQGLTSESSDITKSKNFQPGLYYNELRNYPFLRTIVNILKAPINEAIDQIKGQIKIQTIKNDSVSKDAVIIVNNFFEKCNIKDFIKRHLDEMILRGSYLGYIDYRGNRILDVVDPYNFELIHNGEEFSWVVPTSTIDIANIPSSLNINTMINGLGNFYNTGGATKGLRGNKFVKYYYELETVMRQPRKTLVDVQNNHSKMEEIYTILGSSYEIKTSQKLADEEKKKLDEIILAYTAYRPKSIFEPHLKSLFTLSIKEMVFEMLSLLQYLKPDYFTVALKPNRPDRKRPLSIVQDIKSTLNKYNMEFIKTFEDPSGIIKAVYDKLLNRSEVLPVIDDFNDISILNIPDLDQRLATLFQDIVETKRSKADEIGIAQESISGNSNRWEAISRNEKMVLNEMEIKNTIERFVKQTACDVFYNHVNESYWANKLNNEEYPTVFNFSNTTHTLSKDGVNKELKNYNHVDGVERVGIKLNPDDFEFNLNLSTILDSYASKTKESIISESLQATTMVLENIKNLSNYMNLLDSAGTTSYLKTLLSIGDYTSKIISEEKIKDMLENASNPDNQDLMQDPMAMEDIPEEELFY